MESSSLPAATNSHMDLTNVFHIGQTGYDVVLSKANKRISWTQMGIKAAEGKINLSMCLHLFLYAQYHFRFIFFVCSIIC